MNILVYFDKYTCIYVPHIIYLNYAINMYRSVTNTCDNVTKLSHLYYTSANT